MIKRGRRYFTYNIALTQISLLIISIFALSFLVSQIKMSTAQNAYGPKIPRGDFPKPNKIPDSPSTSWGIGVIFKGNVFGEGPTFAGWASSLLSGVLWGGIVYGGATPN